MAKKNQTGDGCLICGRTNSRLQRGLCSTHHQSFHRALKKLTKEGKEELESRLISEGKLLPSKQGKPPGKLNLFEEMAQQLIVENPNFVKPSVPIDADKNDATIEKYAKEKKPKQK